MKMPEHSGSCPSFQAKPKEKNLFVHTTYWWGCIKKSLIMLNSGGVSPPHKCRITTPHMFGVVSAIETSKRTAL